MSAASCSSSLCGLGCCDWRTVDGEKESVVAIWNMMRRLLDIPRGAALAVGCDGEGELDLHGFSSALRKASHGNGRPGLLGG